MRFLIAAILLSTLPALGQPVPSLQAASPIVVPLGEIDIALTGKHIGDANAVLIEGPPGVSVSIVKPRGRMDPSRVALFVSAPAAKPGLRQLRLVTPHGVTNPIPLLVDRNPSTAEQEPNDTRETATNVKLPAVLTGGAQAELDVDHFAFDARKGQRLIFDVSASRAGSKIDASLALFDPAGKRVASDEDTNGMDPLIDYTVPADGRYVLRIQDLQFKGGVNYGYIIRAGEIPYVDAIFPMGAQRGSPINLELTGRNLRESSLTIPPDAAPENASPLRRIILPDLPAITLALGDHPEARESEPNDTKDQPTDVAIPLTVNGRIDKPGDVDVFRFKGTGGPVVIDVDAARLGSRLDALLTVTDAAGTVVQRNDDAPGEGPDARIQLTTEKDTPYLVWVRDLTDHGGPNYGYRVTIAPPKPAAADFTVALRADTYRVNRGARTVVFADVKPRGGFKGDVTVTLTNLPPGVTSKPLVVNTTQPNSGVFTVEAAPDAAPGFAPLAITATATVAGKTVTRTPAASVLTGAIPQAYLTVHDPAPFAIERLGPATEKEPKVRKERIAALETQLATPTPELEAAQATWEKSVDLSAAWEVVDVTDAKATSGAKLVREPDGSLRAQGTLPATDTYTLTTKSPAAGVRAVRLEALADGATGPGRAENGNFVLNHFVATADGKPVELASATATFTQASFDVAASISGANKNGGWAVSPELGKSHHATYVVKTAPPADAGNLSFRLDQTTKYANHVLGRFRLLISRSEKAGDGAALPADVASALAAPSEKRTPAQRTTIAAYYRSISPELAKLRDQLAGLKSAGAASAFPPVVAANATVKLDVSLSRTPVFKGDITLSLEGYSTGQDPKTSLPNGFDRNFDLKPTPLPANKSTMTLSFKARGNAEKGTRLAILRAEATVGDAKYVVYSEPFPITVK
ncbi:MAG: PPC domain-containing protein [Phycisphaerae bacterium]